jgi:2-oxoglutarate/2-oxoacid ferredoxin oxidoreductase subunit beta
MDTTSTALAEEEARSSVPHPVVYDYLRPDKIMPSVWCEGCSIGTVFSTLMRAIDRVGPSKDEGVMISGIGCSSRVPIYADFCAMHTTHGRPIAFATGVKLANPALHPIVVSGDGDTLAIGGNHFIHAARRNIGVTVILINNSIYGMTGGQYSPATPAGKMSSTSPYGSIERPFDACKLAIACGASFVARGTSYAVVELEKLMGRALQKKGFALVEVISHCHTLYGRWNKMPTPAENLQWERSHAVSVTQAARLSPEAMQDKFVTGVLQDLDIPEYSDVYEQLVQRARKQYEDELAVEAAGTQGEAAVETARAHEDERAAESAREGK